MSVLPVEDQRLRYGRFLPVPAERAELYWSKRQPLLADLTDGQLTALIIATPEFGELIIPELERVDRRNRTGYGNTMGRPARWNALQLESVLLYRRIAGLETIKRTSKELRLDPQARLLLGLGETVPSEPTITRYIRQHLDLEQRAELYLELDRRLRERVMQLPDFDQEARIIGLDGSQHCTRYTAPIPEVDERGEPTGKIINAHRKPGQRGAITAPTAGYVGGHNPKSGKGWQLLALFTQHGTPLAWEIAPLNEAEPKVAERVLDDYQERVLPHRDAETVSVCSADAAFSTPSIRSRLQDLWIVPNIHRASHSSKPETEANVSKLDREWLPFEHPVKAHYGNWEANGHRELRCKCRQGSTERVINWRATGISLSVKGRCASCGTVVITAGRWRRWHSEKGTRFVPVLRGEEREPALGNPLTYRDKLSKEYGQDRFGYGESVHAVIEKRFGLLKDKSWMRDITQVKTEFAIATSAISVLLLERDARRQGCGQAFSSISPPSRTGADVEASTAAA